MKSFVAMAVVAAVSAAAAPAFASNLYGSLGYTDTKISSFEVGSAELRLGARLTPNIALEAQADFGVTSDGGAKLDSGVSGYVVGLWPILSNADLLARVGYGKSTLKSTSSFISQSLDSWNYGVGAQYFFGGGKDGMRLDYTRLNFSQSGVPDGNAWSAAYVHKF